MLKIRVISNYFGNPPKCFPLWLDSCGLNTAIEWVFFTDIDMSKYHIPLNVKVVQCDFEWLKRHVQSKFKYPVRYENPWDFCALKPLIGTIFAEELIGADYWGWSDCDMLYGDLTPVIKLAEAGYDKIMPNGHFSIIRNTMSLNDFIFNHPCTRKAISANEEGLSCYDERDFRFTVMHDYGAKQASEIVPYIHLYPRWGHFKFNVSFAASRKLGLRDNEDCPVVFTWRNGSLVGHFAMPNKTVKTLDLAYVHFFKRNIGAKVGKFEKDITYLIIPSGIVDSSKIKCITHGIGYWQIRWLNFPRLHVKYIKDRLNWSTFIRKITEAYRRCFSKKKDTIVFHQDC